MRPYIVSLSQSKIVVWAISLEDATRFARNYGGDHRTDYRNRNVVEFVSTSFDDSQIYEFSIKSLEVR